MTNPAGPEATGQRGETSLHLRAAIAGDLHSLGWLVERLSPFLAAQADYRLGAVLRQHVEAVDLVNDVWAVALPRLRALSPDAPRVTPLLVKMLSTILLHRVNNLARKHVRERARRSAMADEDDCVPAMSEQETDVVARAIRNESRERVRLAIASLDAEDREILVLRGIEQQPNQVVGKLLGLSPQAVSMRFQRALARLRKAIAPSDFEALGVD